MRDLTHKTQKHPENAGEGTRVWGVGPLLGGAPART